MKNTSPQTYEKKPCRADLSQDILPQYQRTFSSPQGEFHFHEDYELFLFLDGKADIFVEQSRYMLERGSLLAFHSSEVHRAAPDPSLPYERLVVHFHPRVIHSLPLENCRLLSFFLGRRPGEKNAVLLKGEELEDYLHTGIKLFTTMQEKPSCWEAEALSYLLQLLAMANRAFEKALSLPQKRPLSPFVEEAMEEIAHSLSSPLTVRELARRLHVDASYLNHRFREQTGASLYHYILMKKIALAKTLLSQGATVTGACEGAGLGTATILAAPLKNMWELPRENTVSFTGGGTKRVWDCKTSAIFCPFHSLFSRKRVIFPMNRPGKVIQPVVYCAQTAKFLQSRMQKKEDFI